MFLLILKSIFSFWGFLCCLIFSVRGIVCCFIYLFRRIPLVVNILYSICKSRLGEWQRRRQGAVTPIRGSYANTRKRSAAGTGRKRRRKKTQAGCGGDDGGGRWKTVSEKGKDGTHVIFFFLPKDTHESASILTFLIPAVEIIFATCHTYLCIKKE